MANARAGTRARSTAAAHFDWTRLFLPAALLATLGAQVRTTSFYFFQDDYVPFGEIVTNGTGAYLRRLVLGQDLTPNWRVIPGVMYLASYKLFGMNPLPMHIAMLALHLGTVALLYRIVARATGRAWAGFAAAMVFGLQPAYAGALDQVATVPHVAAAFFLVATLNAVFECARSGDRRTSNAWLAASVGLYLLALMSNESMAALFPAFGLAILLFDAQPAGRLLRTTIRTAPFAVLGFGATLAVRACDCTEASSVYSLENAHRAFLIYTGRLLYPVGLEPPYYINAPHLYAAFALLLAAGLMLAFGRAIGRIGAVWMLLAIVPHIFVVDHTANRFTYLATPGFAMLVAASALAIEPHLRRLHRGLPALAGAAVVVVAAPLASYQTHVENEPWRHTTAQWHALHDELLGVFPSVPPGATVEVVGGPLTHPLDNFFVMPALGYTIWGPKVRLQTFDPGDPYAAKVRASSSPFAAEFRDGKLVPVGAVDP